MEVQDFYGKIRQLRLSARRLVEGLYSGNYRSVFRGPGLEFDEVREYDPTDDARFIDWNVSSRLGSPYTKKFREERELSLQILVDVSSSLDSGAMGVNKREVVNILFANLVFAAIASEDRVGAVFFTDRIEQWVRPRKGKTHALSLIHDCLALKTAGRGSDLGMALRSGHEALSRRGIVVILSDFKSSDFWRDLSLVAQRHDVIAIRVHDQVDVEFPEGGFVELVDPESGHAQSAYGNSPKFRKAYHDFWSLHRLFWKRECLRRGVRILEVGTQEDPAAKLFEYFNRRGRTL